MAELIAAEQRPRLVRFVTELTKQNGVEIRRKNYLAVFETPCFYFVVDEEAFNGNPYMAGRAFAEFEKTGRVPKHICFHRVRKVSKNAQSSFCFVDVEKAWYSFYVRQTMRLWRLNKQLAQATKAIEYMRPPEGDEANGMRSDLRHPPIPALIPLGHTDFTREEINWNEY